MPKPATDVLVVGAGPVGLALACDLFQRGLSCRVIDCLDTPVIYSKAAVIHARTMEIMASLGVAGEAVNRSKLIHGVSVYDKDRRVAHIVLGEMDSPYPHVYGISQHDTEALLTERLASLGGGVERSTKLETFTQDDGGVTATISHDGRTEELRASWIAGCDGAHSAVRHSLNMGFEGAPYEERIVQTDAHVKWPLHRDDDEIIAFLTPTGPIACFPFFQDGRYRVLKLYTAGTPPEDPKIEFFQHMLEEQIPGARVTDPSWIAQFSIHHRLADKFRVGRAFLAGDAAHIHSPVGGQGMNTGIQDAHNLGWKLALVHRGEARPSLLDSYEAERRPVARELLFGTDIATRAVDVAMKFTHPVAAALRDGFMSFAANLDFVRGNATQTISMLNRNYRKSPVVAEHRDSVWQADIATWMAFSAGPHPGDRAPDVPGLGLKHLLLLFLGAEADSKLSEVAASVIHRCGSVVDVQIVDAGSELNERYGARKPCLYLIRPDGHVAYRSQPADGQKLLQYLDKVLGP